MRPEASVGRWLYGAAASLAILPLLALVTLFNLPMDHCFHHQRSKSGAMRGHNSQSGDRGAVGTIHCHATGAVTQPILAGVLAGVTAGALSAMIYAMICAYDCPGFNGFWFAIWIIISTAIGGLSGRYALRW